MEQRKQSLREVEELFVQKCKLCAVIFSMESKEAASFSAMEAKRETLLELIELMDGEKQSDGGLAIARH